MKSIAKLEQEYMAEMKLANLHTKKAALKMKAILRRKMKDVPSLATAQAANAEERKKFGCLLYKGMKVSFLVNDLKKNGIISNVQNDAVTVKHDETGDTYALQKTDLHPWNP